MGRFPQAPEARVGRDVHATSRWTGHSRGHSGLEQHRGPLSNALLTPMAASAAGSEVGLLEISVRTSADGDRLVTLHCRHFLRGRERQQGSQAAFHNLTRSRAPFKRTAFGRRSTLRFA